MVNIDQLAQKYDVGIAKDDNSPEGELDSKLIILTDNMHAWLSVGVRLIDDELYAVTFFNNDFFEISDAGLRAVLDSILSGDYSVRRVGLLRKKFSIAVDVGKKIVPERVYDDANLETVYRKLPQQFSRRNA
jgi:hypothetical protein